MARFWPPDRYWHHAETTLSPAATGAVVVDIFKAAAKAKPLGTVEAADADEATRAPQQNSNAAIPPNMMGRR